MTSTEQTVTNYSDLSQAMRSALTDRGHCALGTARALARRGLAVEPQAPVNYARPLVLTAAGERAREAQLPAVGARVRNTLNGLVGAVVAIHLGERTDSVELRWDGWSNNTAGSPAYLEVVEPGAELLAGPEVAFVPDPNLLHEELNLSTVHASDEETRAAEACGLTVDQLRERRSAVADELVAKLREEVTVTVPRALVDAVEAAWEEAYRSGDDRRAERFKALAEAYSALRAEVSSYRHPWLSRALLDATYDAEERARVAAPREG